MPSENDWGPNCGLSGFINVNRTRAGVSTSAQIKVGKVRGWKLALESSNIESRGRGDDDNWEHDYITIHNGGALDFSFVTSTAVAPVPEDFEGAYGLATLIFFNQGQVVVPVRIEKMIFPRVNEQHNQPDGTGRAVIVGEPVWSGFDDTQPTTVTQSSADKEQWDGTSKTYDGATGNLGQGAGRRVIVVGTLSNTDASEYSRLATLVAAATAPFGSLKARPATFRRLGLNVGEVFIPWGNTDTYDDFVLPQRRTNIDQSTNKTVSTAVSAEINGLPPAPIGDNFVLRYRNGYRLHDGATATVDDYGKRTPEQDQTFPASIQNDDSSDLEDTETKAILDDDTPSDPSVPSGLKLIDKRRERRTDDGVYFWVYSYGRRTREEAIEFDGSPASYDASSLVDAYSVTSVESDGTYDPPAANDGYVIKNALIIQRHAASTGEKWIHRYDYARVNLENQIEFSGMTILKPPAAEQTSGINTSGTSHLRVISTNSDPTAVAPTPGDYGLQTKVVWFSSQQMTTSQGPYNGRWQHDYIIGPNSGYDEMVNQGQYHVDPASFGDEQTIIDVDNGDAFPVDPTPSNTDLKLIAKFRQRFQDTPERWRFTFVFGRETREDQLEHYHRTVDPNDFGETERIPIVHTSRTSSPGTPSQVGTSSNLIGTVVDDLVVASGSFTGLYLWTFIFGPTTEKQLIEQEGRIDRDVSLLTGVDVQTLTGTSSTPESDPATRITDMVIRQRISIKLQNTPEKWKHIYIFGWLTEEQEIEYRGTSDSASIDGHMVVSGMLDDETLVDTCGAGDTPDAILGTLVTALDASTTKPWLSTDVVKLTPKRYVQRIKRPGDDKKIILGGGSAGWEAVTVDSTGVYVKVAWAQTSGSGQSEYSLKPFIVWRVTQRIGLVRYYRNANVINTQFLALQGTRDSQAGGFLGRPQYSMAYLYTETDVNWAQEGTARWMRAIHWFGYDNMLHVIGDGVPTGAVLVSTTGALVTGNLVAWSSLTPNPGGVTTLFAVPTNNSTYDANFLA